MLRLLEQVGCFSDLAASTIGRHTTRLSGSSAVQLHCTHGAASLPCSVNYDIGPGRIPLTNEYFSSSLENKGTKGLSMMAGQRLCPPKV